jgi:hypothetical protein
LYEDEELDKDDNEEDNFSEELDSDEKKIFV